MQAVPSSGPTILGFDVIWIATMLSAVATFAVMLAIYAATTVKDPMARRVKALNDHNGKKVKDAGPGDPVEILGFDKPPPAGELGRVVENERRAREFANARGERLIARHERRIRVFIATSGALHEFDVLRRPALHGVGSHPSYNRLDKRFPVRP